ncbi:MAG: exopolysaccharide biosynthesis protein [Gemmobacter sp.]|jgi:hypothetical protein|nr:exopolysaccharide biosynthesis protein [Gemmobacter sp.]
MTTQSSVSDTAPHQTRLRFSELLMEIAESHEGKRITVDDLLQAMEGRASAALLFIFAFPNILPTPPGVAAILGLPLIYLSLQLLLARHPSLPGFIARRSMTREVFRMIVEHAAPTLTRAETLLRERWRPLVSPVAVRLLGLVCLALSVLLSLPVPFGNLMPSAAICIIALAILERDGLWVIPGLLATVAACAWVGGIAYGLIRSVIFVVMNAF